MTKAEYAKLKRLSKKSAIVCGALLAGCKSVVDILDQVLIAHEEGAALVAQIRRKEQLRWWGKLKTVCRNKTNDGCCTKRPDMKTRWFKQCIQMRHCPLLKEGKCNDKHGPLDLLKGWVQESEATDESCQDKQVGEELKRREGTCEQFKLMRSYEHSAVERRCEVCAKQGLDDCPKYRLMPQGI